MVGFLVVISTLILAVAFVIQKLRKKRVSGETVPTGTVLLYVFKPTRLVVNASPPCLKLETYLRMAQIPYKKAEEMKFSSKGKVPWIEFNGRPMADSNFCIRFLNKELGVDVDSHLSETERSIAHTILTMLEENTYWWV